MKKAIKIIATLLIVCGVVLLLGSVAVSVMQSKGKEKQISVFKKAMEKARSEQVAEKDITEGFDEVPSLPDGTLCLLRIPVIGTEDPVKEGVDKSALAASLGHEPDTVMPGKVGNCVIAGHRNYTFGKFFNRLDEVKKGDMIYVDTLKETYAYRVREVKVVEPTEVSILEDTLNEQLTLYTCTPIYIATHRLVIVAERIYE